MRPFARPSTRLYLVCLLIVPLLAWALPVLIVRYRLPPGVEPTMYSSLIDYGYNTAGRNDDVVIFGDSSVLYGVNPRLLGQQLGVKAVNLPNTLGSVTVLGDQNLQLYLRRNRPPRVIVFYFAAWNLDYNGRARDGFMFEGEEALLRWGDLREVKGFAWRHPQEALLFSGRYYVGLLRTLASGTARRRRHDAEIEAQNGHLDDAAKVPLLTAPCAIPDWFLELDSSRTTFDLATRYRTPQTAVLVYIAPVPDCAGAERVTRRSYAALNAAAPRSMAAGDFKDDESFAHLKPEAVGEATQALGDALRPLLTR